MSGHCCRAAATLLTSNLPPTPTPHCAPDNTNLLSLAPGRSDHWVPLGQQGCLGRPTGFINSLIAGGTDELVVRRQAVGPLGLRSKPTTFWKETSKEVYLSIYILTPLFAQIIASNISEFSKLPKLMKECRCTLRDSNKLWCLSQIPPLCRSMFAPVHNVYILEYDSPVSKIALYMLHGNNRISLYVYSQDFGVLCPKSCISYRGIIEGKSQI